MESLTLEDPHWLGVIAFVAVLCALCAWLGARHSRASRAAAWALRVAVVACVCVLLAGPAVIQQSTRRFEPAGTWRLLLHGEPASPFDFREAPAVFAARVRDALAGESPPARCEIHGSGAQAEAARAALAELGMPCRVVEPALGLAAVPFLSAINAPLVLQPGEPPVASLKISGEGGIRVRLDGAEVPFTREDEAIQLTLPGLAPGRHVIEAELTNASGAAVQRAGHVLRVTERPHLLLLGLDDARAAEAAALVPSFDCRRCAVAEFSAESVGQSGVIMAGIDALYRLDSRQAFALSAFVARGGGLYVTGDGAAQVAPDFLAQDIASMLPVTLLPEPDPARPETPPVIDKPTVSEIAKVSVCYVLDRSGSMDAPVGNSGLNRWQVACKGVTESMAKLSVDARASVMAFTLKQYWLTTNRRTGKPEPRIFLEGNRKDMETTLARLASDQEYDDAGFNTDIYAAMAAAIDVMKTEPSAVKMIIMLTDGGDRWAVNAQGSKHSELRDVAEKNGINIVAIGIGDGFAGDSPEARAARLVINNLATRPRHDPRASFAFLPSSPEDAAKAHLIFVNSVETAFEIFDDKKKREEEERRQKLLDQQKDKEPPKIDTLEGTFALELRPAGAEIFGPGVLPQPPPKLQWYARNAPRRDSVVALGVAVADDKPPAALALGSWGFGRVAFWSAGTKPQSLGQLAGWEDFPALFAASLRWLTPQPAPDLRMIKAATPAGITLAEADDGAKYWLQAAPGAPKVLLALHNGVLRAAGALPEGPSELFEEYRGDTRSLGDVFIAALPENTARFEPVREAVPGELAALPPVTTSRSVTASVAVLYLSVLILILYPFERLVRRRA